MSLVKPRKGEMPPVRGISAKCSHFTHNAPPMVPSQCVGYRTTHSDSWCREGEFIFWQPDFTSVMRKFALINNFRIRRVFAQQTPDKALF
jgi:hypothetical protein